MQNIFISLLNTSITAGYLVIAVMLLRPLLKKAPKYIRCILWGLVGLRLILPFSFESVLSLIPSAEPIPPEIVTSPAPVIHSGITFVNSAVNPVISQSFAPAPEASVNPMQVVMAVAWNVWLLGVIAMVLYSVISFVLLKRKLREAVQDGGNVWVCDRVSFPFLLGLFRPKIYLPSDLAGDDRQYVLAHENAHIRRKDHWWKPLGFLLLTVYWFNPLMWVAYIFLCRDIEFACDEKVIKELGTDCKCAYSEALINCSVPRRMISACPVAFGEDGVKGRIKSVLNYKKPAFWIILIALILCIVVAVCFLTNPHSDTEILGSRFETGKCLYSNVVSKEKETESNELIFDIHTNGEVYKEAPATMRDFLGIAIQSDYTVDKLNDKLISQSADSGISIGRVKNTYELLDASGQLEYVFFQTYTGKVIMVSFFSDGNIMNIFRLDPSEECALKDSSHNCRFRATVVEIYEDSLLVEPLEKEEYFSGAKQVVIRLNGRSKDDYRLGCIVEVIYDSQIQETMPPVIPNASSLFNLDMLSSHLPDPHYSFTATVTEVLDDCIIVKYQHFPLHNFEFSHYQVNTDPTGYTVGDKVNISYDGTVTETEPYDILGEVYSIEITEYNYGSSVTDYSFFATVLEVREDSLLIEPNSGEHELELSNHFIISADSASSYEIGDSVYILYDGEIEIADPPVIPNVLMLATVADTYYLTKDPLDTADHAVFDIDSDGILEDCYVSQHPLTGLCVIVLYAYENGILEYCNYFNPENHYEFSFQNTEDGRLSIVAIDPYSFYRSQVYTISVQGCNLVLTNENNHQVEYWSTDEPFAPTLRTVKTLYPQFFGLDTFKGLEVYVWKNGDWRCGVRSGTNRNATLEELQAFGEGTTLREMALILSSYGITRDDVFILYSYDPAFSGEYPNKPSEGNQAYIEDTLFAYLPQRVAIEPYIAPEFQVQKQYPLIVYAYKLAENSWRFRFFENTTIFESTQDASMKLDGLTVQDACAKMEQYDYPPEEIPVIPISSYLSSYYYEINEQTAAEARMILGLIKLSNSDEPTPTEAGPESSGNGYALENGYYSLSGSGKDSFATPYIYIDTAKKTANIGGSPLMSYRESGRYYLLFDRLIVKAQNTTYTFQIQDKNTLVLLSDRGYDKSPIPASGTYVFCGEYPS